MIVSNIAYFWETDIVVFALLAQKFPLMNIALWFACISCNHSNVI